MNLALRGTPLFSAADSGQDIAGAQLIAHGHRPRQATAELLFWSQSNLSHAVTVAPKVLTMPARPASRAQRLSAQAYWGPQYSNTAVFN